MPLVEIGDCFERQWPGDPKKHLWIVITNSIPDFEHQSITVSLTTRHSLSDTTTCLYKGDHSYVIDATVVSCFDAKLRDLTPVEKAVNASVLRLRDRFGIEWVERFQSGLLISSNTPKGIKKAYKAAVSQHLHRPV